MFDSFFYRFIFVSLKRKGINSFILKNKLKMKIVKILFKFILLPIVVLTTATILFFAIKNHLFLGGEDATQVDYLSQHNEVLDKNKVAFNSFDSSFYSNNIFILCENHGFEDVQLVDDQLFIHLNKTQGVRFYIAEMDSAIARDLNAFLNKPIADKTLLKSVVHSIADIIPQQSSQQLMEKWLRIHAYNQQLKDSSKIEVLGLDKNRKDTSKIGRDSSMLLNFNNIVTKRGLQNQKFYGLFGYFHGMQSGIGEPNIYPFAAKLKRNNTFPQFQKVQTIACLTLESEMYMPTTEGIPSPPDQKTSLVNVDGPIALTYGIKDVKSIAPMNAITLLNLNAANSPYKKNQRLMGIKINLLGQEVLPNNDKQATTDFFQYVLIMRGSKALNPLN
jgi:hypothetical protein